MLSGSEATVEEANEVDNRLSTVIKPLAVVAVVGLDIIFAFVVVVVVLAVVVVVVIVEADVVVVLVVGELVAATKEIQHAIGSLDCLYDFCPSAERLFSAPRNSNKMNAFKS